MTNKKFKLAAMSLALTACVAASPLAANAESAGTEAKSPAPAVETPAPTAEVPGENTPTTNETKPGSTSEETKPGSTSEETKLDSADETKQEATDKAKQEVAVENKVLAEAPAAKAPVLMLAKAPAAPTGAPTTPAEAKTVATITKNGTTFEYTSFDKAVEAAESGDTIKVTQDTESDGMELKKDLTIQGAAIKTTQKKRTALKKRPPESPSSPSKSRASLCGAQI